MAMPPAEPEQTPATARTESSLQEHSQGSGPEKIRTTLECATSVNRSETDRGPIARGVAPRDPVRAPQGNGTDKIRPVLKGGTAEEPVDTGKAVPITQEDEVPRADKGWADEGATMRGELR